MLQIQTHPETLLVCRDNELDSEYYDQVYAAKRREALHEAGRAVLQAAAHAPVAVGRAAIWLFSHDLASEA